MENLNEEMIEEFDDMDEDIRKKQDLIEQVKVLAESADGATSETFRTVNDLKRSWNRIHYWESDYEDGLRDQFEEYVNTIFAKRNDMYKNAEEAKQALIARAEQLAQAKDLNSVTPEMKSLMDDWKAAGSAGKHTDDELWNRFQAVRQDFYDRKHQAWEEQNARFDAAREKKQELIEEARKLADSTDWNRTSNKFRSLMDQWKAAGSAGRRNEDALWTEFNALRQEFYGRRSEHYDEVSKSQEENYLAKKALVEEAQGILDRNEFRREQTDRMKALSQEWKQIGYCGKERDDKVWKEFRAVMDVYFDALKKNNEQRHQDWIDRMLDAKDRKVDMIANQKRQIERLEDDLNGLVSQATMENIRQTIADKENFIAQLEDEIADIEEKVNE